MRSGIADYSADLLPHLDPLCDLQVVRLPGQPVAPEVEATWTLVPAEKLSAKDRLPLYQMGNNRHHLGVWNLAMRIPGVLTLHDLVLHHFLLDRTMGQGHFEPYRSQLVADHGWIGEAAALPVRWGGYSSAAQFSLPAHRSLLRRQIGVLVHSEWAARMLEEEDESLRIRAIPMALPLPASIKTEQAVDFRRRYGLPPEGPVVGTLGFQTQIKRTSSVLGALADPALRDAHLLIAGEVSPLVDLESEARRAGVADRVCITGYLPPEQFPVAIAASDVCVNLRYPSAGETSASLLRMLAHGRPVVVSDYAQFSELPHEVVMRVPLGEGEVSALTSALARLLEDPERARRMGRTARDFIRSAHDPARAAATIVEICDEWQRLTPPGDWPPEPPAPSSLSWTQVEGQLQVDGAEPPWREGDSRRLRIRLRNTGVARWLAGERPEGGVVVQIQLLGAAGDYLADRPWLALPRDLETGEECVLEIAVRRPLGPARLRIEPHVLGGSGFGGVGGPVWEREI